MHPAFRSLRLLALAVLAWLPVCAVAASLARRATGLGAGATWGWLVPPLVLALFVLLSTYSLCRWAPLFHRRWLRDLVVLLGGALAVSLGWTVLIGLYSGGLDRLFRVSRWLPAWQHTWAGLALAGGALFLAACLVHYLLLSLERLARAERQASQDRLAASQAELRRLRATIQPHFLFNSLTSLSSLTMVDPPRARRFCLDLAEFLRLSLRHEEREWVSLGEELEHVERYLAIEEVRLGERLVVVRRIEAGVETYPCPPAVLLPLVENAVKHGIATRLEGGELHLSARNRDGRVEVTVANLEALPGTPDPAGQQLGLRTLRERLEAIWPGRNALAICRENGWFRAEISLSRPPAEDNPL